ncbi:hypothetical protein ARAF_0792 [Arsenophonus endosymbiont of Aleurodicus floccissimus]|uniref:DUF6889 family protein n=1 Tax=Arsenophonus endosymbiont of Aleurodicus floccissimus TaxID=2152761 RepID=UPI000EC2442E|nr:hypothetical protein [Arsenophonus endosymbiont of Aleurodicus floccissimus]SPP31650.1 hypothetical protein ARAF_0792 [Arsenophonus endosymbiont of Aleurodicus floccissimus]
MLEIVAHVIGDPSVIFHAPQGDETASLPLTGLTLDSMPDGKDFFRLPVKYDYIKFDKLKDGSIDLADLAEMNG